jgi:DnaJ-class molecular chaperone
MKHNMDIMESIYHNLCEIHGVIMRSSDKQYGLWQLCPKCDGEGEVRRFIPATSTEASLQRPCPVCNGAKILARPVIDNNEKV